MRIAQRGFTLLEAIVALVLIASAGVALFAWINTNLISLQRVEDAQRRSAAVRNALAFMETVNPMQQPRGDAAIGPYTLSWRAEVVEGPRDGSTPRGGVSLFQLALYETEVSVTQENTTLARFSLRQAGFSQVREPPDFSD